MAMRWGIAGTGRIASDFVRDLANVPDATVVAVGSRTLTGAQDFATKFNIPTAVESVDALGALDDVDVVYVAGIHPVHHDHAIAMMRAGKHVLVEKPIAMDVAQATSMVAMSRETNRFLMEAMWMRFNPLHVALTQRLDAGEFGRIISIESDFSFSVPFDPNHRLFDPAKGGGSLLDVGIYPLTLAWWMNGAPERWNATGVVGTTGVDESVEMDLSWSSGVTARLTCGSRREGSRMSTITCETATIVIPAPSHASNVAGVRTSTGTEHMECAPAGLHHQVSEVHRCIAAGLRESPRMTHADSVLITTFMHDVLAHLASS